MIEMIMDVLIFFIVNRVFRVQSSLLRSAKFYLRRFWPGPFFEDQSLEIQSPLFKYCLVAPGNIFSSFAALLIVRHSGIGITTSYWLYLYITFRCGHVKIISYISYGYRAISVLSLRMLCRWRCRQKKTGSFLIEWQVICEIPYTNGKSPYITYQLALF